VSDSFRFVILKYLEREGEHSAGCVADDRHRIASHAKRVSPESVS
jgi:hypothetical protein